MSKAGWYSQRWPRAAWWAPLVFDLALLQAGNVPVGFLITSIDVGQRPPVVTVSWSSGSTATVRPDPEAGCASLREHFAEVGPGLPQPELDDSVFWSPDHQDASPLLVHAWALQELSRSDAYRDACANTSHDRLDLLQICGDTERIEVTLHLVSRGYAVRFAVAIGPPGSDYIGMAYALAENACTAVREHLTAAQPHHGIPTYLGPDY